MCESPPPPLLFYKYDSNDNTHTLSGRSPYRWRFREPLIKNSWYSVSLYVFRQIPSTPRYTNILFNIPVVCASRYLNFSVCFQHSCQGQSSPSISLYGSCNGVINLYKNALDIEQVLFAFLKLLNAEPAMSNHLPPWSRIALEKLSGAHTGNSPNFYRN